MIDDIEDYFSKGCGRCDRFATPNCSTHKWKSGLIELRRICLEAGLTETVKWGHPCYMFHNRNIVILGAFQNDFCISFFNAALIKDAESVLEVQGPNTRHPNIIRFDQNAKVAQLKQTIVSYLAEAISYAEAGIKAPKEPSEVELPAELVEALDCDSELASAFGRLTPGRQRSYAINLNATKNAATRVARIVKFRDKIIAGKGLNER